MITRTPNTIMRVIMDTIIHIMTTLGTPTAAAMKSAC